MRALVASGRMGSLDVLLHLYVGGKADGSVEDNRVEARVKFCHLGGADFAPEAIAAVFTVLVSDEMCRGFETSAANSSSRGVDVITDKRLLFKMKQLNMSVKGILFSELLSTRRVVGALELLLDFVMDLLVLSKTGAGMESLGAAGVVADIVTQVIVFGLDMVLQMALSEEGFVTAVIGTDERAFIGVGALVFGKSHRTGVAFATSRELANEFLLTNMTVWCGAARSRGLR